MQKTKEQISYNMSQVKSQGSKMEITLGKAMWAAGIRYRKHYKKLMGNPDFAIVKHRVAIFCDSEFWHGYRWGKQRKSEFKSNKEFWMRKIETNIKRDKKANTTLKAEGWTVIRFWSREIFEDTDKCVKKVLESVPKPL